MMKLPWVITKTWPVINLGIDIEHVVGDSNVSTKDEALQAHLFEQSLKMEEQNK